MSSFDRFRQINSLYREKSNLKINGRFVLAGYPSIWIFDKDCNKIPAAVVNKEEKDSAYVFTLKRDKLSIGSCWQAKDLKLLITKEITIIKDVQWHKYCAIPCNIEIDNGIYGLFIGPEKRHISESLNKDVIISSNQKPLLILGDVEGKTYLNSHDKIAIKGRGWQIIDYDNISTEGITYYSLEPTTISKTATDIHKGDDIYIEPIDEKSLIVPDEPLPTKEENHYEIYAGQEIHLTTVNGYFKTNSNSVKVIKRIANEIIFTLPNGSKDIEIKTKGTEEDIITRYYSVIG